MKRVERSLNTVEPNVFYSFDDLPVPYLARRKDISCFEPCDCTDSCDEKNCVCLTRGPQFECMDECCCFMKCGRKNVVLGPQRKLEVFETEKRGLGVRALEYINAGEFVCEYVGELIECELANLYTLTVVEHFGEKERKVSVDANKSGNVGRYLNHSCEPNCRIDAVYVESTTPHLCVFSETTVKPGEELCFNYDGTGKAELSDTKCECGSKKCLKYLPKHTS